MYALFRPENEAWTTYGPFLLFPAVTHAQLGVYLWGLHIYKLGLAQKPAQRPRGRDIGRVKRAYSLSVH